MADVINVSTLNKYVKSILESDNVLCDVAITGEISNFTNHFKTGHLYFTLKDEKSSVKAVMFRSDAQTLNFRPETGMKVIVRCRVSLFERDGSFQIYVQNMFLAGDGAIKAAFEALKNRLAKEGLFDTEHKKELPYCPKKIGLITSKTGAAIQDIINVTSRRWPMAHFVLAPVNVQGLESEKGLVDAVNKFNGYDLVDVIIIARGGGSSEDLWVFNSEKLARAVYDCNIPVISAIGHEIDFTILDFVADMRAPTPSAAAEIAVPDFSIMYNNYLNMYQNITQTINNIYDIWYNELYDLQNEILKASPTQYLVDSEKDIKNTVKEIKFELDRKINNKEESFRSIITLCESLNPYSILTRGYAVVKRDEKVVSSAKKLSINDDIKVVFKDGIAHCKVEKIVEEQNGEK